MYTFLIIFNNIYLTHMSVYLIFFKRFIVESSFTYLIISNTKDLGCVCFNFLTENTF